MSTPDRDIASGEATKHGLEADLGDELLFQIYYRAEDAERASEQDDNYGDLIKLKNAHKKIRSISA